MTQDFLALQQISSWMTANLLTLNFSKTEFLLIRLKNQLAKIHNSSFDTSQSTRNLGFIYDEHLTFSDQITSPKPVTITFVSFAVSGLTLIRQLPLLPLLFTPNWITVILCTINSLSLNYPVSSTSRNLLLILPLKPQSPVISLPSYALSTGSESLNASNTTTSFSSNSPLCSSITPSLSLPA